MTCTITPAASVIVARADPLTRLSDYLQAFHFWLSLQHPVATSILLLENSGSDLSAFHALAATANSLGKQVEILSVDSEPIPPGLNYGYAEMKMLDQGLSRSRLRQTTTHMVKVTGRLIFPDAGRALDLIPTPLTAMIDCRKLGFPRRGYDATTQICYFSHDFYDRVLRDSSNSFNTTTTRLLEHLIYQKVSPHQSEPGVYLRFPCNVDPVGFSGFSGKPYNTPATRFTRALRAILRKAAPSYWF